MRLNIAVSVLSLLDLAAGVSLRSSGKKDIHVFETAKFYSEMSKQEPLEYDAAPGSTLKVFDKNDIHLPDGTPGPFMSFAVLHLEPGAVRDMHWHIESDEWIYISGGVCKFTLMDSNGRYNVFSANQGDITYFPKGWQHSFQGVDEKTGCDALLWFDGSDVTIDITKPIGDLNSHVLRQHLNNIPEDKLEELQYPLYEENNIKGVTGVVASKIVDEEEPDCRGNTCKGTLKLTPVFPVKGGDVSFGKDNAGVEYKVQENVFPISKLMSGGIAQLAKGAVRELHWHPKTEEHVYVLKGTILVNVFGVGDTNRENVVSTFEISKGDLALFPSGYLHSFEAIGGDAIVCLVFNGPSWESQTLSQSFAVTPVHITAATLDTTEDVVDKYFPKESLGGIFFPPK